MILIFQRSQGRCLGEAVDIEGLAHPVEQIGNIRVRQSVADTQSRQAIGLGKGAGHDEVGEITQPLTGIREIIVVRVLKVSLVDHHDQLRWQ